MQFKTLQYFTELSNSGSFYAASKALGISQQGLSRAISSLETELGTKLIDRGKRGIRLTESGEVLLKYSKQFLDIHDAMIEELFAAGRTKAEPDDRIRIYVSYYSAQIASMDPEYVRVLSQGSHYIEEPFEKLMKRAASSDGSDLVYLDVFPYSMDKLQNDPAVMFQPTLRTSYGIVWKKGSRFEGSKTLSRPTVANTPMAVNTFRETAQYIEWLFRETPLQKIRMGATSPQMLIEYVKSSDDAIALFDSFSFFLIQKNNPGSVANLGFTPFSTPEARCDVGFAFPKKARLSVRSQYSTRLLAHLLQKNCSEYFEEYPLDAES